MPSNPLPGVCFHRKGGLASGSVVASTVIVGWGNYLGVQSR
jgi:hypothetical protein